MKNNQAMMFEALWWEDEGLGGPSYLGIRLMVNGEEEAKETVKRLHPGAYNIKAAAAIATHLRNQKVCNCEPWEKCRVCDPALREAQDYLRASR